MIDIYKELKSIIGNEQDFFANTSNFAALLFYRMKNINWCGFYLLDSGQLVLGPFQGLPACIRIPLGKGVCGHSAKLKKIFIVGNVHEFPGHIACDSRSNSEIVIPMIFNDEIIGVLDIDSPLYDRFGAEEEQMLTKMLDYMLEKSDLSRLKTYYNFSSK